VELFEAGQNLKILDCGANVGFASVFFLEEFKNSSVVALEIDRDNYNIAKMNLEGRNAKLIHGGVWSENCLLSIGRDFRDSKEWSYYAKPAKESEDQTIQGYSIHELVRDGADIVKIDIEGGEKELFLEDSWLVNVGSIAIEIHDEFKVRPAILNSLIKHGFEFFNYGELVIGKKG
jgi:FkbM family methyltransferase